MCNSQEMHAKVLLKNFWFTEGQPFGNWYAHNNCESSWILSSFNRLCNFFCQAEAENNRKKEEYEQKYMLPACEIINEGIKIQNRLLAEQLSDRFLLETAAESFSQQGYPYDYAQKKAAGLLHDSSFVSQFRGKLIKQIRTSFEQKMAMPTDDIEIDFSKLWSDSDSRYRYATLDNVKFKGEKNDCKTMNDAIGLHNVCAENFSEYQYLLALREILNKLFVDDKALNNAIQLADASHFVPENNENGLPGANWNLLETVISENESELDEDIRSLVRYCAYNESPDIKESWIFQYVPLVRLGIGDEEKEAESIMNDMAKSSGISPYIRTMIAFSRSIQMNVLCVMCKALGDDTQTATPTAVIMKKLGIQPSDFDDDSGKEFISDLIRVMEYTNIDIDTAGMDEYLGKKSGVPAGKSEKRKWIAVILCLFFGCFGAHKFYEGKTAMGILYLFTCGLFLIGALVDFFRLLFKPDKYYV